MIAYLLLFQVMLVLVLFLMAFSQAFDAVIAQVVNI